MFEGLASTALDPILGLALEFSADARPDKVDLGIGVYRDDTGRTPIPRAVREAERRLFEIEHTKSYVGLAGDPEFNEAIAGLVLGSAVDRQRVCAVQAPGGSGALRILLDVVGLNAPQARVWIPDPSWPNHVALVEASGLAHVAYPYVDAEAGEVAIERMMKALAHAAPGDVVLLHGCCHNPTGADPTLQEWTLIGELLAERGAIPLVDIAYQGFGDGLDEDAAGLRLLAGQLPEVMIAQSCSKNFGVYRDRVGAAIVVARDKASASKAANELSRVVRYGHSMPPAHGAAAVRLILQDAELSRLWRDELETMRSRMSALRSAFAAALYARSADPIHRTIASQKGMFARLRLDPGQVERLRREQGIYMVGDGRVNIAGLSAGTVERVADSVVAVSRDSRP